MTDSTHRPPYGQPRPHDEIASRTSILRRAGDLLDDAGHRVLRLRGARALRDRALEALAVSGLGTERPAR
ncbi:hypothetical protein GCM10009718_17940 [Isoptericola halotolerans]|uniref:Uncharacterized protein n=1 Tax=Isoptericola halotolerans TaxID=300560 RepID=A0ABX2A7K9_9MICO|nr:hypothetical protein [Isoptericola halotolerans]NOV98619.1 hypothetical protein [Isoptericola halotolerans]